MGLKGGSEQSSKTKLPDWYTKWAKLGLDIGNKAAQVGYVPYQGPDVAAFAPQQIQGMQQANDWAAAFGGKGAVSPNVASQIPKPQTFAGGIQGYSSYPGYMEALEKLKKTSPGLYQYLLGFAINPQTGDPAAHFGSQQTAATPQPTGGGGGGGGFDWSNNPANWMNPNRPGWTSHAGGK